MPKIPEYEMQTGELETGAGNIPEIRGLDKAALAMQNLGENISSMGAHMIARGKQKQDTDAAFQYRELEMAAQENTTKSIDTNEAPDGAGITDNSVIFIRTEGEKILKTLPNDLKKDYAQKIDLLARRHALHASSAEDTKRTRYYGDETEKFANSKASEVANDPSKFQEELDSLYADIDKYPIVPSAKDALKKAVKVTLTKGKGAGDLKRDPNKYKRDLGGTEKISSSGAILTDTEDLKVGTAGSNKQAKQLAFVWHELRGDDKAPNTHGKGSEAAAYGRLTRATTLEAAVQAGITYERPSIPSYARRLSHARQVLNGTATKSAMRARAYFESKGMSAIQASGMVGVLMGESGSHLNPNAKNPNDPGTSIGVAQWNRDRKANMLLFTGSTSTDAGPIGDVSKVTVRDDRAPPVSTSAEVTTTVPYEHDPAYDDMSFEWRQEQINKANAEINRQEQEMYNEAKYRTERIANDAITSFQTNGDAEGIVEPTLNDFVMINDGDVEKGTDAHNSYLATKAAALKAYSYKSMTPEQIQADVDAMKAAIPVGEGSKEATDLYDKVATIGKNQIERFAANETFKNQIQKLWDKANEEIAKDKNAEVWFAEHMDYMWKRGHELVEQGKMREADFMKYMTQLEEKVQMDMMVDTATRLSDEYDAAVAAQKNAMELREHDPFLYTVQASDQVKQAWELAESPDAGAMRPQYRNRAIEITYNEQKRLGIPQHKMRLLPKQYTDTLITALMSPVSDMSEAQKQQMLASTYDYSDNVLYKNIMFEQFKDAGLPSAMKFALWAHDRGDDGAYARLFTPALAKDLKPFDETKLSKVKENIRTILNEPTGQAVFGSGDLTLEGIQNVEAVTTLIQNAAIVSSNGSTDTAARQALQDIIGPIKTVQSKMWTGVRILAAVPNTEDASIIRTGFEQMFDKVTLLAIGVEQSKLSPGETLKDVDYTRIKQSLANGTFRNYLDGYGFKLQGGGFLADPKTGDIYKWSLSDIKDASKKAETRSAAELLFSDKSITSNKFFSFEYPLVGDENVAIMRSPEDKSGRKLEFWPPGEEGAPDSPRPENIPLDRPGVQVFGNKVTQSDIAGDIVSHQMIKTNPTVKGHYEKFRKAMTPEQNDLLKRQYDESGDDRPYVQWRETTGIPALMRGYAFNQWPEFKGIYTVEQKKELDAMMKYLRTKKK